MRRFVARGAFRHAVGAHVLSRVDYASSVSFGARDADLGRLRRLQCGAARLGFACGQGGCSVELLNSLHWLQVKDRICFKMMLYVYKCIMNVTPLYLCDLVTLFGDTLTVRDRLGLRSSSGAAGLLVPRSGGGGAGGRSFFVASPGLWSGLPVQLGQAVSVPVFGRLFKTHL